MTSSRSWTPPKPGRDSRSSPGRDRARDPGRARRRTDGLTGLRGERAVAAHKALGWSSLRIPGRGSIPLQASPDKRGKHAVLRGGMKSGGCSRCMSRPPLHFTPAGETYKGHCGGNAIRRRQAITAGAALPIRHLDRAGWAALDGLDLNRLALQGPIPLAAPAWRQHMAVGQVATKLSPTKPALQARTRVQHRRRRV